MGSSLSAGTASRDDGAGGGSTGVFLSGQIRLCSGTEIQRLLPSQSGPPGAGSAASTGPRSGHLPLPSADDSAAGSDGNSSSLAHVGFVATLCYYEGCAAPTVVQRTAP